VLEARCFGCHAGSQPDSELALDVLRGDAPAERTAWSAVRRRVAAGEMPPAGEPELGVRERDVLLGWIDAALGAEGDVRPEPPRLRRLNRREVANSVRDLFGVAVDPEELPADDVGHGFDTIAAVLATSELLLERHLRLAERVAAEAVPLAEELRPRALRVEGADLKRPRNAGPRGRALGLNSNGEAELGITLRRAGVYALRARLWGDQAGDEPCRVALKADGRELQRFDVPEEKGAPREIELQVELAAGARTLAVAFLNDHHRPDHPDPGERDRNLVVGWIELEGPLDPPRPTRFQREELGRAPDEPLAAFVARTLRRAWRRPATAGELRAVLALAQAEPDRERAARAAITAALVSPHFLYRIEAESEAGSPAHRLAADLSYFLWSSAPDEDLARLADSGLLDVGTVLRGQVRRMLADPRAAALSDGFAVQWLQLGRLERAAPDPARFPTFDDDLRTSMLAEAVMVFDAVLRENRPARALLGPGFTFVDERLAAHYGLSGVQGSVPGGAMRRVPVEDGLRGGALGLAAVLTATSNPTRTSPSARGKFVLEALLGDAPPPPPPNVGVLDESAAAASEASLRERLERHRSDPACQACHVRIDPIGLGLETLDATGRWRARDGRFPIEPAGALPDGRTFADAAELQRLVAADPRFARALMRKLAVYALGRGLDPSDEPWLEDALLQAGPDPALSWLIEELVLSPAFR
jgi:hypothetical protein